jgi:hypothetical protein
MASQLCHLPQNGPRVWGLWGAKDGNVDRTEGRNILGYWLLGASEVIGSKVMKKNFIKERKQSRGEPSWYLVNFLRNFARARSLMHSCIRQMSTDKLLIEEAKRNYMISMTSALETFYHDLFVYILEKDDSILEDILADIKEGS